MEGIQMGYDGYIAADRINIGGYTKENETSVKDGGYIPEQTAPEQVMPEQTQTSVKKRRRMFALAAGALAAGCAAIYLISCAEAAILCGIFRRVSLLGCAHGGVSRAYGNGGGAD